MTELKRLRQEIGRVLEPFPPGFQWDKSEAMSKALAEVKRIFDSPSGNVSQRSAEKALLGFRRTRVFSTYLDLKYVCFALAFPVGRDSWRLLEDKALFTVLLIQIQKQLEEPRRFRKCYQGALAGYWNYPILEAKVPEAGRNNWTRLRDFLREHLPKVVRENPATTWVNTLKEHENLLADDPCKRYGSDLLRGDDSQLANVRTELGIPSNCWVMEQAVYAQAEVACEKGDDPFKDHLESLLSLTTSRGNLRISDHIAKKCLARVLQRYAKCSQKTEHTALRDAAILHFGNPWLRREAWDAFVKSEDARKMVESWLKIRLITDFFSLLSEDGSADERRLKYWLRFEPVIEDMWFVLGTYADHNRSKEFVEIRQRARGRLLALNHGGAPENNAFIMRIGDYVLVEFSARGNACFIFRADGVPFNYQGYIECSLLKSSHDRMVHRDFPTRRRTWEDVFDEKLLPLIKFQPRPLSKAAIRRPAVSPPQVPINRPSTPVPQTKNFDERVLQVLYAMGLPIQDNRQKDGALWVKVDDSNTANNKMLSQLGFKHKPGRGWWKE
jgi:hypothetical protein